MVFKGFLQCGDWVIPTTAALDFYFSGGFSNDCFELSLYFYMMSWSLDTNWRSKFAIELELTIFLDFVFDVS